MEKLNPVGIYDQYYKVLGERETENGEKIKDYKIPDYEDLPILAEKVQLLENLKNNNCLIIKVSFSQLVFITAKNCRVKRVVARRLKFRCTFWMTM